MFKRIFLIATLFGTTCLVKAPNNYKEIDTYEYLCKEHKWYANFCKDHDRKYRGNNSSSGNSVGSFNWQWLYINLSRPILFWILEKECRMIQTFTDCFLESLTTQIFELNKILNERNAENPHYYLEAFVEDVLDPIGLNQEQKEIHYRKLLDGNYTAITFTTAKNLAILGTLIEEKYPNTNKIYYIKQLIYSIRTNPSKYLSNFLVNILERASCEKTIDKAVQCLPILITKIFAILNVTRMCCNKYPAIEKDLSDSLMEIMNIDERINIFKTDLVNNVITEATGINTQRAESTKEELRKIINNYFCKQNEEFASYLTKDFDLHLNELTDLTKELARKNGYIRKLNPFAKPFVSKNKPNAIEKEKTDDLNPKEINLEKQPIVSDEEDIVVVEKEVVEPQDNNPVKQEISGNSFFTRFVGIFGIKWNN